MQKNENRPGYKKTKVGWIPEEWELVSLKDITDRISDGIHTTPRYVGSSEYHFINGNNLVNGQIRIFETTKCVDKYEFEKHRKDLDGSTILLSINGTIGSVAYYNGENVVLGKSAAYIKCSIRLVKQFAFYQLLSPRTELFFRKQLTGSTIQNLSLASIRALPVPCPTLSEQKAIAEVLSAWDRAIEKTERLIQAKEKRFSWLLNTLINQESVKGEWRKVKLGELFGNELIVEKGSPLIKENTQAGNIPVVAGGQTYPYYHDKATHTKNCITISASGAYAGFVWFHDYPIWASDCNVICAKTGSTQFFYYALKSMQHCIFALQAGGAQPHVYAKDLKNLIVPVPAPEEQKRIAETLNLAQREIELLKKLAEKQKLQKRGLMQKLLTGEWRVKVED